MPRRTAPLLLAGIAVASALVLSACSGSPTPAPTTAGPPDPDATLTVGLVLEPSNLDIRGTSGAPLDQLLIDNVYQGLVTRDPEDNSVIPALASSYEVSDDGLVYTFALEQGVVFHDGTPLTSADVVGSLTQAKDDASVQGHGDVQSIATIEAPDESTVVVTLTEPDSNFLFALTGRGGLVFKNDDATDFQTEANGTGPFRVSEWRQGDSVTLERNDDYWGEPAGVAEVVLTYIPDFTAGVNAALDGSVDVLTGVDPNLAPQLEESGDFTLTSGKTTDKATLAFNNAVAPLDDVRVREALRLAIDHEALIAVFGGGNPLYGPIPELDPGYEDLSDVAPFDPERAIELLDEAGVSDLELTLTIPSFYGTTVSTFLISAFSDIGVELKVDAVDFPTWLQDVYTNKDYELSYVLHVEAHDFGNWANPDYYFNYDNAEVQDLYARALASTDDAASAELLAEAARMVSEDMAADWLFNAVTISAVGASVQGFPVNSVNVRLGLAGVTVSGE